MARLIPSVLALAAAGHFIGKWSPCGELRLGNGASDRRHRGSDTGAVPGQLPAGQADQHRGGRAVLQPPANLLVHPGRTGRLGEASSTK
jgi:hypothetical protein